MDVKRKIIQDFKEELENSFGKLLDEMANERPIESGFVFAGLMNIEKKKIDIEIVKIIGLLNELKKVKPYNPKKQDD